jgi:hypothetical protein
MLILLTIGSPILSFAISYQYDAASRLVNLQSTYPGGVDALYFFCTDKLSEKLNYLANLGISFSDADLAAEKYVFLGSCIYGEEDLNLARCTLGSGGNCQSVTLPLDLPTLERLSKANAPSPAPNSTANFY